MSCSNPNCACKRPPVKEKRQVFKYLLPLVIFLTVSFIFAYLSYWN